MRCASAVAASVFCLGPWHRQLVIIIAAFCLAAWLPAVTAVPGFVSIFKRSSRVHFDRVIRSPRSFRRLACRLRTVIIGLIISCGVWGNACKQHWRQQAFIESSALLSLSSPFTQFGYRSSCSFPQSPAGFLQTNCSRPFALVPLARQPG